jgi:4-hydroxy-2-oxoheptanedioate aldolase
MINKKLRVEEALKGRGVAIGTWARMECPEVCELIGAAGFDFVVIDTEHGSFGLEGAVEMIRAAEARGTVPVVRLPDNSPTSIKKILDAGAVGIFIPGIRTGEEAIEVVKAAKYAPIGTRGTCGWVRANDSSLIDFEEYSEWSDKNTMVWVIIENIDAVKNLDSILASGVDAVAPGGGDLARSMGLSNDHPDVVNSLNHIAEVAKRKGVSVIGSCGLDTPQKMLEEARLWKKNGARYILFPPDRNLLAENYRSIMSTFSNQKLF